MERRNSKTTKMKTKEEIFYKYWQPCYSLWGDLIGWYCYANTKHLKNKN